ncbi:MAG TPA: HAD-IA family hydrolase [Syntrophorhabdaceae bacterium]|jgi:phosphoglycolate phosphatase
MGRACLILDFDGTIIDSGPIFFECMNELGEEFGYADVEPGKALREMSAREIFTTRLGLSPERLYDWTGRFKELLRLRMVKAIPFPGMKEAVGRLRESYCLGILTSNSEDVVRHILHRNGFGQVDFIFPDAPILEKDLALARLLRDRSLQTGETLYVGDEVRDIDACRKTGIRIVSVTWGFNSKEALCRKNPDFLVDSAEELVALLFPSAPGVLFPQTS